MPIYEYECQKCKRVSEFLVGVSQTKEQIQCKYCKSKKMTKKISSGLVSKGSKTKQDFCAQKGPCSSNPSCMYGGGCPG